MYIASAISSSSLGSTKSSDDLERAGNWMQALLFEDLINSTSVIGLPAGRRREGSRRDGRLDTYGRQDLDFVKTDGDLEHGNKTEDGWTTLIAPL